MFFPLHDHNPIRHIGRPYVTWGLIGLNVAIFFLQTLTPGNVQGAIYSSFGLIPAVVGDSVADLYPQVPAWATFFTYAFLHGDAWHLAANMLFLFVFGDNIEDAMGHLRFLAFYLICAAAAGLVHFGVDANSVYPLIGASGAISGVIGAYLVLYPQVRIYMLMKIVVPLPIPIPAVFAIVAWVAIQVFYAFAPDPEGVAWWAHVGGFAAGAALVALFKRRDIKLFGRA
jgi:membrane associated rhomboid family serine protease